MRDSGVDMYWPVLFLGRDADWNIPGHYVWRLRPELMSALEEAGVEPADDSHHSEPESFFDFLRDTGLEFSTEAVENFLLSLKAKQFVILSGGTGTGKTKLAQAYGLKGKRVTNRAEMEQALQEALSCGCGYVIDCQVDMDEMVRPMVAGGAHITDFLLK